MRSGVIESGRTRNPASHPTFVNGLCLYLHMVGRCGGTLIHVYGCVGVQLGAGVVIGVDSGCILCLVSCACS